MKKTIEAPVFSDVLSIPSNPEDLFTLLYPIGIGGFGKVYKAMHNSTNQIFAIKIIDYTKDCITNRKNISFNYESIQQETSVMRLIQKNDYIVKYYGSYYSRKSNTIWLILEYCGCGSAVDLMLAMDRTLSEIEVSTIMEMVLKGLINIHKINLIHRDIKGSNILLSEDGYAKLGDFGVGIQLTEEEYRTSKKGSPYWMSPQVVLNEKYDTKTDIWSLGITCVELVEGEPPNSDLKPGKVMELIANNPPKVEDIIKEEEHTDEFINFVSLCLETDPSKRPTALQLIKHPFITKLAQGREYLAKLIKNNIDKVERYRMEEEEKNKTNQSENNIYENEEKKDSNSKSDNNIMKDIESEEKSLKPKRNDYNLEKVNNSYSQDSKFINKSLQNSNIEYNHNNEDNNLFDIDKNESENKKENNEIEEISNKEENDGTMIINQNENNESLNFGEMNGSLIINGNNKSIGNESINNELYSNKDFNSFVLNDENEDNKSMKENKVENAEKPAFMQFIEAGEFIDDDLKYEETIKKRQLQELKEKYEYLKNKQKEKEKKKEEKNNFNICNNNESELKGINQIIQTPQKNTNNKIKNNDDNYENIDKYYEDIKINEPNNNLLVKEERENIEQEKNNDKNQRSCITSNCTQANSKGDINDDKNNFNSNLIFNKNNKIPNNRYNFMPLQMKLNFYENNNEENKQDTSNIDESDSHEEKIYPIKNCIINLNFKDNKLEKSMTEVKTNRKFFLEKIKNSENKYNFNFNLNDEDCMKTIHISSFKPHKKYFN